MSGGYGRDGIGIIRALRDRGHHVTVAPIRGGMQVPLPVDIALSLSVENYQDPSYDIRIVHQSPLDVGLSLPDAEVASVNIWWSMWEWENYPDSEINNMPLGYRTKYFDYFVAYDSGTLASLGPHLKSHIEQITCQGGYESEDWMPDPHYQFPEEFIVGTLGDMSGRKNPFVLMDAFRLFKDRNPEVKSRLVLKSRKPLLGPLVGPYSDPEYNIVEVNGVWTRDQMERFYRALGVYVAPSYGEGKNLPALEAATNGVPLILSDIPGHKAWASVFDSVLFVGGERANLRIEGIPMWGLKVDVEELAQALQQVYDHRVMYTEKARSNVQSVAQSMDWTKAIERLGNLTKIGFL